MQKKILAKMRQKQGLCIHRIRNPFVKPFQKYICGYSLMDSTGKQRANPVQSWQTSLDTFQYQTGTLEENTGKANKEP